MNVDIYKNGIYPPLDYGDEIGAFATDGQLVGSCVYTGNNMAFVIWGLDEIAGLKTNDYFNLRVWRKYKNALYNIKNVYFIEGDDQFHTNKISIIGNLEIEEKLTTTEVLIYPNPASDYLIIKAGSAIKVSIFDLTGRCIFNAPSSDYHIIKTQEYVCAPYFIKYYNEEQNISGNKIIIVNH